MAKPRMQHCCWCGEELGVYASYPGDIEACGKAECQREARAESRARDDEARYAAEQDNYERYRF